MEHWELSWRERGRLWLRLGIRLLLTIGAVLLFWHLGPPLLSLLMPFVLALVMAWVLNPLVKRIQKRLGISRKILSLLLILLLFAVVGGILAAFLYSVGSEIISLASNWQAIWDSILVLVQDLGEFFSGFFSHLPPEVLALVNTLSDHMIAWLQAAVPSFLSSAATAAGTAAMRLPSFAIALVIFITASYFVTSDYPRLRLLVTDRLSSGLREFFRNVKRTAVGAFGGYVKAQLILSVVVFFILLAGFALVNQPYSVLLAFLLAALDFIPILGSGTVMIPWAVLDLFTGNFRHAVEMMVIWGIIALFRRFAEPKIVGDQTGLSPILSLVSIYIGMKLAGVWGMILGPILSMVLLNIIRLGVFSGLLLDLRLAGADISALLKSQPREPPV
ncbi:MAG: sporulation integral membrane protein YtvI [Pseudoflavonifractor sp.]